MGCAACCRDEFKLSNFGLSHDEPWRFYSAEARGKRFRYVYLAWRVFWALYHTIWIILTGVYTNQYATTEANRVKWFIYLTNWAYFFLTLASIVQLVVVIYNMTKHPADERDSLFPSLPWYMKVEWVLYNVASAAGFLIFLLFWGLLYTPGMNVMAIDIEAHGINALYIVLNVFITGMPTRIYHMFHTVIFGAAYILFSVAYQLTGNTNSRDFPYIYEPLDWTNPGTAAMYAILCVFVGVPILHAIYFGMYRLRLWWYCCCCKASATEPFNTDKKDTSIEMNGSA